MKTLITSSFKTTAQEQTLLNGLGLEITYQQDEYSQTQAPEQYEAVICYDLFRENDISRFGGLKYLQITSAGTDHLPMDYIRRQGIVFNNARGVYSVPMAEFALGGVLQLYKKAAEFRSNQQQHIWRRLRGIQELAGKQVCIVGMGSIGSELAKRFSAFDAQVIGVDILPVNSPWFSSFLPASRLDEALSQADIVVLALPLMASTRHFFNRERFGAMQPGSLFVNVARGAVVEQEALVEALNSGHLQGAVLDVFEPEPLPEDSPLWDMPNVLVTPHNSFLAESNRSSMFKVVLKNLQDYLAQTK